MKIDILIDKLTPCLVDIATGNVLQTTFSVAPAYEISLLTKTNFPKKTTAWKKIQAVVLY